MNRDSTNNLEETEAAELLRLRGKNAELEAELAVLRSRHFELDENADDVQRRLRNLDLALSYTPDLLYIFDVDGRFTYVNRALRALWQKSQEEALGKNFFDLGYPVDLATKLQGQVEQVVTTGENVRDETAYTGADGRPGYYDYIFVPVLDENGMVQAVVGSTREITERKKAEAALRESEERFSAAFEDAPVGMVLTSPEGAFIEANSAYVEMLGYSREELATKNSDSFTHPDDVAVTHQYGEALRQGEIKRGVIEKRYFRKDGQLLWARASGSMRYDSEGRPNQFIAIIEDITQRKRAEEALQASQERLQKIFAQAPVAVCLLRGLDMVFELANPYYRDLLGGREIVGRPLKEAIPEASSEILELLQGVLKTGEAFSATEFLIPLDRDADGMVEDYWFNFVYQPLREPDGAVSGILVVAVDVTSQVQARQALEHVNRELEEFAYVASHDLQEPLRMVNVYTQLLMRDLQPHLDDTTRGFASQVSNGVRRMEQLLRDLLHFSQVVHGGKEDAEVVRTADLNTCFRAAVNTLQTRIEDGRATVTSDPLPTVQGEETQLTQVFQNLISNALKYSKANKAARVRVTSTRQGGEWIVSVADNGIGFEQEQADRVFGLFKRLHKEQYPGTGLGLAICKRIVERYGGRIWARSAVGEGSTFSFAFPVLSDHTNSLESAYEQGR